MDGYQGSLRVTIAWGLKEKAFKKSKFLQLGGWYICIYIDIGVHTHYSFRAKAKIRGLGYCIRVRGFRARDKVRAMI